MGFSEAEMWEGSESKQEENSREARVVKVEEEVMGRME